MALSPTIQVKTFWGDRDKRQAQLTLYLPLSYSLDTIISKVTDLVAVIAPLSNAVFLGYTLVWRGTIDEPGEPNDESDVNRFLGLFYRNEEELQCEALWIPSPTNSLFEVSGDFAGIRANLVSAQLVAFTDGTLTASLRTPEAEAWPQTCTVGVLKL